MWQQVVESRAFISYLLSAGVVWAAYQCFPFAASNPLLQLVAVEKPYLYTCLQTAYVSMLFSTPYIVFSVLFSLAYIFLMRQEQPVQGARLPLYVPPANREQLYLTAGELHHPRKPVPAAQPQWLTIPDRGLFTGIAIFGAIGSGKTSGCMYPFAEQVLAYQSACPKKRIGGLILEVKGDFCHKVRHILRTHGREEDYVEISLDTEWRYNPLHNDLDAYALAYGIASLLNNLFGKGKDPFWQQAYTNLVKFIILLHKVLYDYVTLFDIYQCAINPDLLEEKVKVGEKACSTVEYVLLDPDLYVDHRALTPFGFELDQKSGCMKALLSKELKVCLQEHSLLEQAQIEPAMKGEEAGVGPILDPIKREQFEAVKRWFYQDWKRIEPKLRTSIVEGISVFLSLFDDNPAVKRVFCPPKETYTAKNPEQPLGKPLPSFGTLLEQGKVCALNFPVSANPGLARAIGTLMKQDFQRAVLNRIPQMEQKKSQHWREVLFLCDEYQSFATVGESDPTGDEKFFALSRQAKCIAIVATQSISSLRSTLPGESWRTLLQTFRTKLFLSLSDDFSTRVASDLCGKDEQLKLNYSISENGQDARVSVLTGRTTAHRSSISASKSYSVQRDYVFEAKVFSELKNAQAIVLAYDGLNPLPPSYCYLKPYYLDVNTTYFEQLARGEI